MLRRSSFIALSLLAASCAVDDNAEDSSDAGDVGTEAAALLPASICMPNTCGLDTTPYGCGMQDDGCGGTMWCGPCDCGTTFTACEIELPTISESSLTLAPNTTVVIQTSSLSSGADSVLHLLTSTGTQLAMNDDISSTNKASRITYTSPPLVTMTVRIVALAKSASTTGTATLTYGSTTKSISLVFAAHDVASTRAGDKLQTAPLPNLAGGSHVVYTMSGANITARTTSSAGVSIALPSSGTTRYLIGNTSGSSVPARLLRNDEAISGHDPDQDDLGSDLESKLGTCSQRSGTATDRFGASFNCALAADARDTDGDGLHDDWEVRGRLDVSPTLPLGRWGADPRHKDIFVEVDYGRETASEPEEPVTESEVLTWARHWDDRTKALTAAQRAAHAASIQNPNGKLGVRLHVDSGVAPTNSHYAALYGNWGGHGIVPPASEGHRMDFAAAREQYMGVNRRGVFRYGLRANNGGGQGGGLAFVYGGGGDTAAHETGHTASLYHDGRYNPLVYVNCKPNYPSIMNYAFDDEIVGFTGLDTAPLLNNARLREDGVADPATQGAFLDVVQNVFGYTVYPGGDVDWNRDGVIAPAPQTVEAWANYRPQNSCEYSREGATTAAGPHTSDVGPALAHLLGRTFIFSGMAGQVGWTYTSSALSCRAPLGGPCGSFSTSGQITGFDSEYGVDAVKLSGSDEILVVGVSSGYTLRYARITGFSGSTPLVSTVKTLGTTSVNDQPTLAINETGTPELYYRDATGALHYRRYIRSADAWGAENNVLDAAGQPVRMWIIGAPGATLAPPLDGSTSTKAMHLVFAGDATGCMQLWRRNWSGGYWVRDNGMPSCVWQVSTMGRPAIAWVPDAKEQALGGRLHIVHTPKYSDPEKSSLRQLTSVSEGGGHMALEGLYDNDWAYSYGIDLLYEPGVDTNLRAAWTWSNEGNSDHRRRVRFDPKADGITDYDYGGEDDWRTMRRGICAPLAAEQSPAVACPAAP